MRNKRVNNNGLHVFDLRTAKRTSLPASLLPLLQAEVAHQVTTGLQAYIFVVFSADFAELKCGAHLAVQLILLLRDSDMFIRRGYQVVANIRVVWFTIRIQITRKMQFILASVNNNI